jgi:hypothetical protein
MAKIYLDPNDSFSVASNNGIVYGATGSEKVTIFAGVTGTVLDQNTEVVVFAGATSSYTYQQAGNQLKVYSAGVLVATVPTQDDANGTLLTFTNGTVEAKLTGAVMAFGGTTVTSTASSITPSTIDPTNVTYVPTYAITTAATPVNEGATASFLVKTTNVADGTVLPYTLSGLGITAADITGGLLTGNATVTAGVALINVALANDLTTEGAETLAVTLDGHAAATANVVVTDTSLTPVVPVPTYAITIAATPVNEGATASFLVTTTNVVDGTVLPYTLSGLGITAADITGGLLTGNATVTAGVAIINVALANDLATEGAETLAVTLDGHAAATANVVVTDTSSAAPTYAITTTATSVNEGATASFGITTTNVADGTVLPYTLSGLGITAADITGGLLTGTTTVTAGVALISVALANDLTTEGAETLAVTLDGHAATATVVVNDTSVPGGYTIVPLLYAPVTANPVAEAFVFDFQMIGGRPTKAVTSGEVSITGFDVAHDKLVFNDVGTGTVYTEAQFMALPGVVIAENPFNPNTSIYVDPLAAVSGGVTLVGVLDSALATIVLETTA